MKKLFYRLSSSRSFAKLLSIPVQARLEERRIVMFPKSSVCTVVALAAFMSLGSFLFPPVGQAQEECVWNCDLGSDIFDNPWGNSPQSQLDIAYCVDPSCVIQNFTPIVGPIPSASTAVGLTLLPSSCSTPNTVDVEISGNVVAMLRDGTGSLIAGSAAQAQLSITIKCTTLNGTLGSGSSTITRVVVPKELQTNVFAASSSITILKSSTTPSLSNPKGWTGCFTNNNNCAFPLGIVQFNNDNAIKNALPPVGLFAQGEVFHAEESNRFVGIRDCKGDANGQPSTIACSVGKILTGGNSLALLPFPGNWSGSGDKTFNPKSSTGPFDIGDATMPFPPKSIVNTAEDPVTASANGGNPIAASSCSDINGQNVVRCSFSAKALLPGGCKSGDEVDVVVTGKLVINGTVFKFVSEDKPICSNGSK
jgi:hypothetical protein